MGKTGGYEIDGLNVESRCPILFSPMGLKAELVADYHARRLVYESRQVIRDILDKKDGRLLVIAGPCSVHDEKAAYEYAEKLAGLQAEVAETIFLVMRFYPEKPPTGIGWEGLVNDPFLNGTDNLSEGIRLCRQIALGVLKRGVPIGGEFIDPMFPPFYAELFSWASIGARNSESQTQRRIASGLSACVGFKNGIAGDLNTVVQAMKVAREPNRYPGISQEGRPEQIRTKGNRHCHMILRGNASRPNYDSVSVRDAFALLKENGLPENVLIDCSHGNSVNDPAKQGQVWHDALRQRLGGNRAIIGMMLESNLREGKQKSNEGNRKYGVSITDACIGWDETAELILGAHKALLPKMKIAA